jgi:hypothetical protein
MSSLGTCAVVSGVRGQSPRISTVVIPYNSLMPLSSGFANNTARKRKLMRNLKSKRKYAPPIRGGRRSRISPMSKATRIAKAREIFNLDPTLLSTVSIIKSVPADNQVFGWASVSFANDTQVADMEGDMIDLVDLEKAAYNSLVNLATGDAANDTHDSPPFGRMIESMVFSPQKIEALGLPSDFQQGWWVGLELPPDRYQSVISGDRLMFSIEGRAIKEPA